jgi:hypothetical protein
MFAAGAVYAPAVFSICLVFHALFFLFLNRGVDEFPNFGQPGYGQGCLLQ